MFHHVSLLGAAIERLLQVITTANCQREIVKHEKVIKQKHVTLTYN